MIKRVAILTSGGDAPGMNAAVRAATRAALTQGLEVYAVRNGYLGLYEDKIERFDSHSVSDKMRVGGTFIGTARLKTFTELDVRKVCVDNLKRYGIDAVVAIGGDGTYRGAQLLSEMGIATVAIPGTIDNDIAGTDLTIGFDTALNTAVDAVDKLRDTSASHHRCSIVEVMGRNCGDIAVWTAVAVGAECVICKETGFDLEHVIKSINKAAQTKNHAIIIVAEKILDVNELAKEVTARTPFQAITTVLGYLQRGGKPTARDRVMASEMGVKAIDALLAGESGACVCVRNNQIITRPILEALGDKSQSIKDKYEIFKRLW